jgi:hypothetical protein
MRRYRPRHARTISLAILKQTSNRVVQDWQLRNPVEEPSRCYTECRRFWFRFAGKQVRSVASWFSNSIIMVTFGTRSSRGQTLPVFPTLPFPIPGSSTGAASRISQRDVTLQRVLYSCVWPWRRREQVGVVLTSADLTATTVRYNEFEGAGHWVGKNAAAAVGEWHVWDRGDTDDGWILCSNLIKR